MENKNKVINRKNLTQKGLLPPFNSIGSNSNNKNKNNCFNINIKNINTNEIKKAKKISLLQFYKYQFIDTSKSTNFNTNLEMKEKHEVNKLNKTYSESDLGEVGGVIEDEGESEILDELNEFGNNIFINNPKSIITYSSDLFKDHKDTKIQSLSVSKDNKNITFNKALFIPLKTSIINNHLEEAYKTDKYSNISEINEITNKIKIKNKYIENIIRLIENEKKNIIKYDNEIKKIDNCIQIEEKERDDLQYMINFFNNCN